MGKPLLSLVADRLSFIRTADQYWMNCSSFSESMCKINQMRWDAENIIYCNTSVNPILMKIEQLIGQYLLTKKSLSLQQIGRIRLNDHFPFAAEPDKPVEIPEDAVAFEYDSKAAADEDFIQYIVEQTKKIKPLATSDLESFTMLARQFLNIGKPLTIEGIGLLIKNQSGQFEFKPASFLHNKLDLPQSNKEKDRAEIDFSAPISRKKNQSWLAILFIAGVLSVLAVVFFVLRQKSLSKKDSAVPMYIDTSNRVKDTQPKTTVPMPDTVVAKPATTDSFTFKIVIREYTDTATAIKIQERFKTYGHRLMRLDPDSNRHWLAMPFVRPFADTIKLKDSLKVLFGGMQKVVTSVQ